jgi:hypothetical protein
VEKIVSLELVIFFHPSDGETGEKKIIQMMVMTNLILSILKSVIELKKPATWTNNQHWRFHGNIFDWLLMWVCLRMGCACYIW